MPEISVSEKILSEDYADLILPVTLSGSYFLNAYMQMGGELLGGNYGVIHVPLSSLHRKRRYPRLSRYGYRLYPADFPPV